MDTTYRDLPKEFLSVYTQVRAIADDKDSPATAVKTRARFLAEAMADLIVLDGVGEPVKKWEAVKRGFHTESVHAYLDGRSINIILRNIGRHAIVDNARHAASACYAITLAAQCAFDEAHGIIKKTEESNA